MTEDIKDIEALELRDLYRDGASAELLALIASVHAEDIARLLGELEDDAALWVYRQLPSELASDVLIELEGVRREFIVSAISETELVEVIEEMDSDDATDVIAELPSEDAKKVLDGIDEEGSLEVQKLLKYADDTAGGKMQVELVSVSGDMTVRQAIEVVRERADEVENLTNLFVVSGDARLEGVVPLTKLILAKEATLVKDIADKDFNKVTTDVDQEEVARIFQRHDLLSMPVVDDSNRLVGRITIDDVVDVIEEEIFEDFYKMASLNTGERVSDNPGRSFKMRAPWLLLNLATAFMAAGVVKVFEDTIASLVILAVFMPVVAGIGGNAATQTITVMVRGLALGEIGLGSARRVLIKETLVGVSNGLLIGALAAIISYFFGGNIIIGLVIFLAMTGNLVIAGFSGAVIPLLLRWRKLDPALASSVLVTTFTDIGGFFIFLGLATIFMRTGIL